jgi:short subunit dehydrogenase-like uncharacterized protein
MAMAQGDLGERDLDVVVFGATGVTGRRVAAYLADRAPQTGARWAAAGRDATRLRRVLAQEGVHEPETVVADVADPSSLVAMAERAKVVLDLVGPYSVYGRPVIEACVDSGAHYADLTGEIPFMRQVVDEVDERAHDAGVKVVQACGFESLPPDLAVALAAETARRRWHEPLADVDLEMSFTLPPGMPRPSDLISGGTFQSMAAVAASEADASSLTDPAALVTDPVLASEVRRRSPIRVRPRRGTEGAVVAPMAPAAFINPAVIQRTAALSVALREEWAGPFAYREGVALTGPVPTLPLRVAAAGALAGVQVGIGQASRAPLAVRRRIGGVLERMLPGSGYGPAADRLEGWRWQLAVHARTTGGAGVHVRVDAEGHPGYLTTARMLGEAGLMLAESGTTPDRAGCLTPATALGTQHVERFAHARLRFAVDDTGGEDPGAMGKVRP